MIGKILFWHDIIFLVICVLVVISCFFELSSARRKEKLEYEARIEEKEYAEIDPGKKVLRAEKLYKMNQKELMRYYDMNLIQTKFLSVLGIVMILLGVLIVVASIFLYVYTNSDNTLLFAGSGSGIIIDFVGTLFIRMYTKNVEAAIKFYGKFAESNNLLLANSIAK